MFRFSESRESRQGSANPPSETRIYNASGSSDQSFVYAYAAGGGTPAYIAHAAGVLYRQDIKVDPVGFELWRVEVPYGPRQRANGSYSVDFDTTGGTLTITNSLETVEKYAAPGKPAAPDMKGAIGVDRDEVRGAEIVIPALKLTVNFQHPQGIITLARIKNLARWTGKQNEDTFLTFEPGEILFLGATGREGTEVETEVSYQFAASENIIGKTIGDIVGVNKKGWEHSWISYEDAVDGGLPVKRPRWLYVERIYEKLDLGTALGFGS